MSTLSGIYRATVVNNADPTRQRRLLVQNPTLFSTGPQWAEACVPYRSRAMPPIGSTVWLQFEGADGNHPVWVGVRPA
jgi:hypothetical protein